MSTNTQFPCSICDKQVRENSDAIFCDFCKHWVHRSCNELSKSDFLAIVRSNESESWSCLKCNCELFPFNPLFSTRDDQDPLHLPSSNSHDFSEFFKDMNSVFDNTNSNQDSGEPSNLLDCKYYDVSEFSSLANSSNFFSFLHLNISSLSKHFDNFTTFLSSLHHHFKVIAITESRILKGSYQPNFNLEGYHHYSTPTEAKAGGTMLLLSNTINSSSRPDLDKFLYKPKLLESTFAEISLPKQSNIIVGSIYKHPSLNISEFEIDHLSPLLDKISKEGKTVILMGDFNINLLNSNSDENISNFLDTLGNHLILPQITLPTRVAIQSKTLIDNIFMSPTKFERLSGNITTGISDHLPQFLLLNKSFYNSSTEQYARDWKNFDRINFTLDFLSSDWEHLLDLDAKNPDSSFDSFFTVITSLLDEYAPSRRLTKKQLKSNLKPWITIGIKKSIQIRDKLLNQFIKCKNNILKLELHHQYKLYRNSIVKLIRTSKQNYFTQYFQLNSKSSKKLWQGINEYLNRKKNNNTNNITLNINGNNISEPLNVANIFNNFFTTIADNIRTKIPNAFNNFHQYLNNPLPNSFFFKPVSTDEMILTINSLSSNKASGPFSIPFKILNILLFDIASILTKIINLSFETGVFPSALKLVKVIPIFKNKGSTQDFNNYRPISLLSNIDKIFEKLVHSRLISYLDNFNALYRKQYGFRKKHSTAHALISLTEQIRKSLDNGQFSCGVFIDLQKAFDTVDHNILLEKLKNYGIRGVANQWFRSYLTGRKQFVFLSGKKSEILKILHGVPQGSVLGPLLFILYINDINNCILHSKTYLFADDTGLLNSNNSLKTINKQLNADLRSLFKWLCANKISLNVTKTEVVLFHHSNKEINHEIKLKLNGKKLDLSNSVKYLGLQIDKDLSFSSQINSLSVKLRNTNGALSKIRHVADEFVLKSVYNSLFVSHLSYACQTWAQCINLKYSRIFKLQKAALRILTFSDFQAPSKPLFLQLNLLYFSDLVKLRNILLVHDILNAQSPTDITDTYSLKGYDASHNTRGRSLGLLAKPQCRTTKFGLNSVTYQSILNWNDLQSHYKEINLSLISRSKLQNLAFNYFLQQYIT